MKNPENYLQAEEQSQSVEKCRVPMEQFEPLVPSSAQRRENPAQYWEGFLRDEVQKIAAVIATADVGGKGLWKDDNVEGEGHKKTVLVTAGQEQKNPWVNVVRKAAEESLHAVNDRYKDQKGRIKNNLVSVDELVLRAFKLYEQTAQGALTLNDKNNKTALTLYRDELQKKYQPHIDDVLTAELLESEPDMFETFLREKADQVNDGVAFPLDKEERAALIEEARKRYYAIKYP
jgi:hypothetical protein